MRGTLKLLTAGWKAPSLVDIRGKASFMLWLCGCNLRCPFCHNWEIAEGRNCRLVQVSEILEALEASAKLVDALHVTGGEPLIQYQGIHPLLEKCKSMGLYCSVNTNCTLPRHLERLASAGLVDHIATDLKIPTSLAGLPETETTSYIAKLLDCAGIAAAYRLTVELRIPVPRHQPGYISLLSDTLAKIAERLSNTEWYIIVNPLVGLPVVNPRDPEWCSKYCNPAPAEIESVIETAKKANTQVYLNHALARLAAARHKGLA